MIGPMSDDKSFINVPCNSKEVVYIECANLECGRRPAHVNTESLARYGKGGAVTLVKTTFARTNFVPKLLKLTFCYVMK
jgi:hypothetical protein